MTEYKRFQGKSYMVVSVEGTVEGYEASMLAKNNLTGFLPFRMERVDDGQQFWYDISGRQSLEDWFARKKAEGIFLRKFMGALRNAIAQAGRYLLCEDGISLLPEQIFMDAEEREISFCYLPFSKTPFTEALRGFMEYYISHMQHGGAAGVKECYAVYEKCQEENVDLEELLSILFREEKTEAAPIERPIEEEAAKEQETEQKEQFFDIWKEKIFSQRKTRTKPRAKADFFAGRKKKISPEAYAFTPEEYPSEPQNLTVFLGSETKQILGELRYEGDGRESNLKLKEPIFVVGSHTEKADGVIANDSVSRLHAKLTKEADDWYLEDLNSTNGTFCNGEPLNYRERVKLKKNDKVTFAQESYRFV